MWTRKHKRGIGEEKSNSFGLGAVGNAPLWRRTRIWAMIEFWWAKWSGEGIASQAEEAVWAKIWRHESGVCSRNSSWYWVAGKGRANGKMWRVWLWMLKKTFLEHTTASMWWCPNECATVPSVDACHSWRLQSDPLLLHEDIKACYSALKTWVPWLHGTGRPSLSLPGSLLEIQLLLQLVMPWHKTGPCS